MTVVADFAAFCVSFQKPRRIALSRKKGCQNQCSRSQVLLHLCIYDSLPEDSVADLN